MLQYRVFTIKTLELRHVSTLSCGPSSRSVHQYLFKTFIQILISLPEIDPQERVETRQSSSVLIVKMLYCRLVHLLMYSWTLTVCAWM